MRKCRLCMAQGRRNAVTIRVAAEGIGKVRNPEVQLAGTNRSIKLE